MLKAILAPFRRPTVAGVLEQFQRTVDQLEYVNEYNRGVVLNCDVRINELSRKRNDASAEALYAGNVRNKILALIQG